MQEPMSPKSPGGNPMSAEQLARHAKASKELLDGRRRAAAVKVHNPITPLRLPAARGATPTPGKDDGPGFMCRQSMSVMHVDITAEGTAVRGVRTRPTVCLLIFAFVSFYVLIVPSPPRPQLRNSAGVAGPAGSSPAGKSRGPLRDAQDGDA